MKSWPFFVSVALLVPAGHAAAQTVREALEAARFEWLVSDDVSLAYERGDVRDILGAVDSETGQPRWSIELTDPPALADDRQLLQDGTDVLVRWSYDFRYQGALRSHIVASFDRATGSQNWRCEFEERGPAVLLDTTAGPRLWNANNIWRLDDPSACTWSTEFELGGRSHSLAGRDELGTHERVPQDEFECLQEAGRFTRYGMNGETLWQTQLPAHFGGAHAESIEIAHGRVLLWYEEQGWAYELDDGSGTMVRSTFLGTDGFATFGPDGRRFYVNAHTERLEVTDIEEPAAAPREITVRGRVVSESLADRNLAGLQVVVGEADLMTEWCFSDPPDPTSPARSALVRPGGTFQVQVQASESLELMLVYDQEVLGRLLAGVEPPGDQGWLFLWQEPMVISLGSDTEIDVELQTEIIWEAQMGGGDFDGQYVPRFARVWADDRGATNGAPVY